MNKNNFDQINLITLIIWSNYVRMGWNSNELDESVLSPFASKLSSHLTSRSWEYFESNRWGGLYSHGDGTNNCWFPLARKWPTWKWTWIWNPYGKIEKKCPRYFRPDSRRNPRGLNMCPTGRSVALSHGGKSMPQVLMKRESMKLVVQQRKFT